ncbi:flagellar basal body rod C-terminal domain-containing protein, partial [Vibrio sp. 10N.222.49.C9]
EGEPEELYTRAGDMVLNDEGEVTIGGRSVLTEDGPLVLPLYQSIQVSNDGVVSVVAPGDADGQEVAALKLVNPTNSEVTLDRSGLFRSLTGEPLDAADDVTMRSGFLEGSNVSVIEELTGMLKLSRQFEVNVKMMVAAQDIGRAGNEVMQA